MKLSNDDFYNIVLRHDPNAVLSHLHDDNTDWYILADWNNIPSYIERYIDKHCDLLSIAFNDEYSTCSDCYGVIKTIHYDPNDYWIGDGFIRCATCTIKDSESYIEYLVDNPRCVNTIVNLEELGFVRLDGQYENGLHVGQNDDPVSILEKLLSENRDREFIFNLVDCSPFTVSFDIFYRVIK